MLQFSTLPRCITHPSNTLIVHTCTLSPYTPESSHNTPRKLITLQYSTLSTLSNYNIQTFHNTILHPLKYNTLTYDTSLVHPLELQYSNLSHYNTPPSHTTSLHPITLYTSTLLQLHPLSQNTCLQSLKLHHSALVSLVVD